jgi:hypothetical protein
MSDATTFGGRHATVEQLFSAKAAVAEQPEAVPQLFSLAFVIDTGTQSASLGGKPLDFRIRSVVFAEDGVEVEADDGTTYKLRKKEPLKVLRLPTGGLPEKDLDEEDDAPFVTSSQREPSNELRSAVADFMRAQREQTDKARRPVRTR